MWKEMNGITNDDGQGACTVYLLFYFHSTTLFLSSFYKCTSQHSSAQNGSAGASVPPVHTLA